MNTPTQLTTEHLAAHMPYGVKVKSIDIFIGDPVFTLAAETISGTHAGMNWVLSDSFKLVLRPLSQLTEQITHNGETFVPMDRVKSEMPYSIEIMLSSVSEINPNDTPYGIVTRCLSWHFDVFSLGDNGPCVYMNPDGTI